MRPPPSLRAHGSRERAPDDRLHEAIQFLLQYWIASSLPLLAMTVLDFASLAMTGEPSTEAAYLFLFSGFRFSMKAAMPSRPSFRAKVERNRSRSTWSPSESFV